MRHAQETRPALAERPVASGRSNFDLVLPVRALRKELGLAPNDLAVLTALVSFLPRDSAARPGPVPVTLAVVFPSNAALSERTNGLDERTLRRSIGRLVTVGLVARKDSANGKRFPLRYGGVIRDAFGFDLQPLIRNQESLALRAANLNRDRERLRSLKAEALALRAALLRQAGIGQKDLSNLEGMRNILRRATLTVETVHQLIADMRKIADGTAPGYGERFAHAEEPAENHDQFNHRSLPEPGEMSARHGQNVRHTESTRIDSKESAHEPQTRRQGGPTEGPSMTRDTRNMEWRDFRYVADYFPEPPQTATALTGILHSLGTMLRISQHRLTQGLNRVGASRILLAFDCLIARAGSISQPDAYFDKLLRS